MQYLGYTHPKNVFPVYLRFKSNGCTVFLFAISSNLICSSSGEHTTHCQSHGCRRRKWRMCSIKIVS